MRLWDSGPHDDLVDMLHLPLDEDQACDEASCSTVEENSTLLASNNTVKSACVHLA